MWTWYAWLLSLRNQKIWKIKGITQKIIKKRIRIKVKENSQRLRDNDKWWALNFRWLKLELIFLILTNGRHLPVANGYFLFLFSFYCPSLMGYCREQPTYFMCLHFSIYFFVFILVSVVLFIWVQITIIGD